MFDSAEIRASHRAKPLPALAPNPVRPTKRPTRRSSPKSSAFRRTHPGGRRRYRYRFPTGWAPTPAAVRRPPEPLPPLPPASWDKVARSRLPAEVSEDDLEWEPGKFFVKARRRKSRPSRIVFAALYQPSAGHGSSFEATHYYDPPT